MGRRTRYQRRKSLIRGRWPRSTASRPPKRMRLTALRRAILLLPIWRKRLPLRQRARLLSGMLPHRLLLPLPGLRHRRMRLSSLKVCRIPAQVLRMTLRRAIRPRVSRLPPRRCPPKSRQRPSRKKTAPAEDADAARKPEESRPAASAAPAGAPVPPAATGGKFRVQLAALQSEAQAQQEWSRLKTHYSTCLRTVLR